MGLPFLVSDKVQERIQISSVQKKFLAFQNLEFMVKFDWSGKREQDRSDRRYCFRKEEEIHASHRRQGINNGLVQTITLPLNFLKWGRFKKKYKESGQPSQEAAQHRCRLDQS